MIRFLALAFVGLPHGVAAGVVTFTSQTAFVRAAGPLVTETFSKCGAVTTAFVGPLTSAGAGPCAPGAIAPGLALFEDAGADGVALYSARRGYARNRSTAIGQNGAASGALHLELAGRTRALGFMVHQNFGGGATLGAPAAFEIALWNDATQLGVFTLPVPEGGAWFGAIAAPGEGITRASINNPLAYDLVSTVRFSPGAALLLPPRPALAVEPLATPAPGAAALLGLAATIVGWRRRNS